MRFERGRDPKGAMDVGVHNLRIKVTDIRFILLDPGEGQKVQFRPDGRNNVEACIDIEESHILIILEKLAQGSWKCPGLLEITEEVQFSDFPSLIRWRLGDGLAGAVISYQGKDYIMPEEF